jgi:hypothetical protein
MQAELDREDAAAAAAAEEVEEAEEGCGLCMAAPPQMVTACCRAYAVCAACAARLAAGACPTCRVPNVAFVAA